MFRQFFRRYQTLLIFIGGGLLVLGGWLLLSNFQLGNGNVPDTAPTTVLHSQDGSTDKQRSQVIPPNSVKKDSSQLPGQQYSDTDPTFLSQTEQKIYEMGKQLAANGPWTAATEEQYRIERAKILTEGMDSLSALKHLQKLKEHHKSIAEYAERAVREHPNNVEALLDWAFYLDVGSDERKAVYHRILELDPNSANALNRLGMSVAYDDPHTAIEYLTKVEELQDPAVKTSYSRLALAYQRLGEYDKAVEVYRNGYEASPHSRGGARMFAHLQDLEAGIYKVPLWQPEEAETGNRENQVPDAPDNFTPEMPTPTDTPTETDGAHTPEDAIITDDTATVARKSAIDREIQEFFKNMSDTQSAAFEKFIANEYPEFSEPSLPEPNLETQFSENFSPERFSRAMQTLKQYGPEEGIRRLKKEDPAVAKRFEYLFLKRQQEQ